MPREKRKLKLFNPREMMELAVDVMRKSVPEPRPDGKISPKVGAVLVKPDGTVEKACRSELRYGDHAEFTLLERKNRGNKLDGSVLFATLEPCAPGARRDTFIDCAERIRLARIKTVWVGIQDPDPKVARKGIQHLENSGIEVHMFDRDLQGIITEENKEFLKQAYERAAEAKKGPAEIVLSPLENSPKTAILEDFFDEALERYRSRAGIKDIVGSPEFNRRLLRQGFLKEEKSRLVPTGFGILLFGKEPRLTMPQAGLLALINYPNGTMERKEFDEPAVLIPENLENWLKDKLPNVFERTRMQRTVLPALPFEMVREAVINALIHRDYGIEGAKCHITLDSDTIVVRSPGGPIPPITLEQLQKFSVPMLSRNPALHLVFARMEMTEEQGIGLVSIKKRAIDLALPLPRFTWDDPYLVFTLYLSAEAATKGLDEYTLKTLSEPELRGWQWIAGRQSVSTGSYAKTMGLSDRMALYHLNHFAKLGLLRRSGSGPATRYEVVS